MMTALQDSEIRRKSLVPYRIRIEPRMAVPRWLPIALSVGAVTHSAKALDFSLRYRRDDAAEAGGEFG